MNYSNLSLFHDLNFSTIFSVVETKIRINITLAYSEANDRERVNKFHVLETNLSSENIGWEFWFLRVHGRMVCSNFLLIDNTWFR
jgi:hypothetical protein